MDDYQQPEFYKFCEGSLKLVEFALIETEKSDDPVKNILDPFAGCGVLGIEFLIKYQGAKQLVLIEKQAEFLPYIERNLSQANVQAEVIHDSFLNVSPSTIGLFDLILVNPPFYDVKSRRAPQSELRKICLLIENSELEKIVNRLKEFLKPGGVAYFLLPQERNGFWEKLGLVLREKGNSTLGIYSFV